MLPIRTSAEDLASIIDYLKTKATGATIAEAKGAVDSKLLDGRKISAYVAWGFIEKDGERLKLTEPGRNFGRASDAGRKQLYGEAIRNIKAYHLAAEWFFHQKFSAVSAIDLAAHWHEHVSSDLGTDNEKTIVNQATCFFSLCEASGLGTYYIGRKGQPTRIELEQEALSQFIAESGLESKIIKDIPEESEDTKEEPLPEESDDSEMLSQPPFQPSASQSEKPKKLTRVFISHGKNLDIVDRIKTMLDLADLEYEVAIEEESTAIPVPDKVFSAMHNCTSAVICVTADDEEQNDDGSYRINDNVLIEIGAAFVLFDKKVVLVWDKRIPIPSNLQGLYRCEFEGNELTWSAGMKLMKAVNKFKKIN